MSSDKQKTLVIDLDGTLCSQETFKTYHKAKPNEDVIRRVNELWANGWRIVIYTARGMNTLNGNVRAILEILGPLTEGWLKANRVSYDKLCFGKPPGDLYVDDKGKSVEDFLRDG